MLHVALRLFVNILVILQLPLNLFHHFNPVVVITHYSSFLFNFWYCSFQFDWIDFFFIFVYSNGYFSLDDGHFFIIFFTLSLGLICFKTMGKLRFGLNCRGTFWFFVRFVRLSFFRVNLFQVLMCFFFIIGLINCWSVFWRFIFPSRQRIITVSMRRFIKPRFFVQFF